MRLLNICFSSLALSIDTLRAASIAARDTAADTNATTLCFSSALSSPASDCKQAISNIVVIPEPKACIAIYAPTWNVSSFGSCTIETYSATGGAACLDDQKVKDAATRIVDQCAGGDPSTVGGISEIPGSPGDGVRILEKRDQACSTPGSAVGPV